MQSVLLHSSNNSEWTTMVFPCFTSGIMWIFLFIVILVTLFLMVTFKNDREQLRNRVLVALTASDSCDVDCCSSESMSVSSLESQLLALSEKLTEKETQLRASRTKIVQAEQKLYTLQANSNQIQDRYKTIMKDLKSELEKTEAEVKIIDTDTNKEIKKCRNLHDHINIIAKRREELRKEVIKHQASFNETVDFICKDLDVQKEVLCSEQKSSRQVRISEGKQNEFLAICDDDTYKNTACQCKKAMQVFPPRDRKKYKSPPFHYTRDASPRMTTTRHCYPIDDNLKSTVTQEVVEYFPQDDDYDECSMNMRSEMSSIGTSCPSVDNRQALHQQDSCLDEYFQYLPESRFVPQEPYVKKILEVSDTLTEYERERDEPTNVCDCCVKEYKNFRNSKQGGFGMPEEDWVDICSD